MPVIIIVIAYIIIVESCPAFVVSSAVVFIYMCQKNIIILILTASYSVSVSNLVSMKIYYSGQLSRFILT